MTEMLQDFVRQAINPVFDLLGDSLLATPRLDQTARIRGLWTGSLVVANTCLVLLVVVAGFTLMGNPTVQAAYTVKDIAPRLVVGVVLANASLLLIEKAIAAANALSAALLGPGVDPRKATDTIRDGLHAYTVTGSVGAFLVWIVIIAVLLAAALGVIYLLRLIITVLLIAVAPLALMCHCLPQTEGIARLWWRGFAGVLAIQVAQAVVLIAAMRVWFDSDWYTLWGLHSTRGLADLWITLGLLYVLVRIPAWITGWIWRGGLRGSPVARTAQIVVAAVVTRRITGTLAAAGRGRTRLVYRRRGGSDE